MTQSTTGNGLGRGRLLRAGVLSVAAAVAANLIAYFILRAALDLPADFPPLSAGAITLFTIIGTGLGALAFAWLARRSATPARPYVRLAAVALVVSILPNLAAAANPALFPFPGGTTAVFLTLVVFHMIAAVVSVVVLLRLAR
jgi:hypothetical protein